MYTSLTYITVTGCTVINLQPYLHVPWSKVAILGILIPPLMTESLVDGYINPYGFRLDVSYPILYGNNGS